MANPARANPAAPAAVVLATAAADTTQLRNALAPVAKLHVASLDAALVLQRIEEVRAEAVLIDFRAGNRDEAAALARAVRLQHGAPLGAIGRANNADDAIAALRANVQEFIDVEGEGAELQRLVRRLLEQRGTEGVRRGAAVALLGARAGLGTSTLAANLAHVLQQQEAGRRVLLVDMGMPVADSETIVGVRSGFDFAEAARGLDRLDRTMVDSAIPRNAAGVAVLPLPAQLQALREISHAMAASAIGRLRQFFDAVVLDLGGFTNTEFVARMAAECDRCFLVCDQAATSVLSSARLAAELADKGIACGLVANRADAAIAPAPAQVAAHLKLELAATLPERYQAHVRALNEGTLLAQAAPSDAYTRAVQGLAEQLLAPAQAPAAAGGNWINRLRRLRGAGS